MLEAVASDRCQSVDSWSAWHRGLRRPYGEREDCVPGDT